MVIVLMVFFFFFKQKTAYEMRISDWSSDVCSSDLQIVVGRKIGRLDDEDVLAADVFVDFDEDFLIGEAAHAGVGERQFQIVRDRAGERKIDRKSTCLNSSH